MKRKTFIASAALLLMLQGGANANVNYTVEKGDSYWNISQKFNITMDKILETNNATEYTSLYIGQQIKVPSDTYTVQKGDSYYLIAKKCGVSLSALLEKNNASANTTIYQGQKIIIPGTETNKTTHTVQKGESFWTIAKKYGVSLSELLLINNATNNSVLYVGDTVVIPEIYSPALPPDSSGNTYVTYTSYTVKNGDTLWNIALENKIPYSELLEVNSLTENSKIYAGMNLKIPVHHIPVKEAPKGYGELLEWFSEAQYVIPINSDFRITDLQTGKSFNARRTIGSGHADCEPLTASDTEIMKEI